MTKFRIEKVLSLPLAYNNNSYCQITAVYLETVYLKFRSQQYLYIIIITFVHVKNVLYKLPVNMHFYRSML